jgi:hypothetical protein
MSKSAKSKPAARKLLTGEEATLDNYKDTLALVSHDHRVLESGPSLPEDFDWREYLTQNPDLQADGIIFKGAAIDHYLHVGVREGRPYTPALPEMRQFDWRSYLELNPDLDASLRTESAARQHFKTVGRSQGRPFGKAEPDARSWTAGVQKLDAYLHTLITNAVDIRVRNLVVYHVEDPEASESSADVIRNNLRVFLAAVKLHPQSAEQRAFYMFNVVSRRGNPLLADIPTNMKNVAVVTWALASSDMYTHIYSLSALNREMQWSFSAVYFSSTGVRGPLVHAQKGEWLSEFRKLLDAKGVGIAGSTISCHGGPHVQTHFFGLRSALVPAVLREVHQYYKLTTWTSLQEYFDLAISAAVVRAGHRITSALTQKRFERPYFDQNCTSHGVFGIPRSVNWDYHSWCELESHDVVFVRWGGEPHGARADRYLCGKGLDMSDAAVAKMEDTIMDIAGSSTMSQKFTFTLPESPYGGVLQDLFKQYRQELWRERRDLDGAGAVAIATSTDANSQVCFLVRTSIRDDPDGAVRAKPEMKDMDLSTLVQCTLSRITCGNSRALLSH